VHESSGLERVPSPFPTHALAGDVAEVFVNGGEDLLGGRAVTGRGLAEQAREARIRPR